MVMPSQNKCFAMALVAICAVFNAGCGSFADPAIVVDLRALAITAEPAEQVVDVDPNNPNPIDLVNQLVPVSVCALLANPGDDRPIAWTMKLCAADRNDRCTLAKSSISFGQGEVVNPQLTVPKPNVCATLMPTIDIALLLNEAVDRNLFSTFGGINLTVELKFAPVDEIESAPLFASKVLTFSPRIPAARKPNLNPNLQAITAAVAPAAKQPYAEAVPLMLGRCVDLAATGQSPLSVAPGARVKLLPVELDGTREDYVIPTLSGGSLMFTESPTYQWLASAGGFTARSTGGPRDGFGNPAQLDSDWKVPTDLPVGLNDISLWLVQRDERLGARWFDMCIRVAVQ
jgi:hypothetical protein